MNRYHLACVQPLSSDFVWGQEAALHRLVTCCSRSFALGNLSKDVFEQRTLTRSNAFFPVNMPWLYQIFIAKCLCSSRHDLPENFAQECKKSTSVYVRRLKTSLPQLPKFDVWLWSNIPFTESWISFNVEGTISNPSLFCGFYVFFRVFSFDILYVISKSCNLRENNFNKINVSFMYALDSSCCRSHFYA